LRVNEESIFTSQIKLWYLSDGVDVYYKYYEYKIGFACSSPLNIFIHVIPEDGPYGPKHVVKIIRA
jgi:hypothetical protein